MAKIFGPTGKVQILIRTEIRILPVSTSIDLQIRRSAFYPRPEDMPGFEATIYSMQSKCCTTETPKQSENEIKILFSSIHMCFLTEQYNLVPTKWVISLAGRVTMSLIENSGSLPLGL